MARVKCMRGKPQERVFNAGGTAGRLDRHRPADKVGFVLSERYFPSRNEMHSGAGFFDPQILPEADLEKGQREAGPPPPWPEFAHLCTLRVCV